MRRWLRGKAEALRSSVPLIGMFYSCGLNTWCLMYITVLLLAMRKRAAVIPCLPSLVNLAIYTFASVNAYIRYSMPLFAVTPLLLAWLIHHMRQAAASGGSALPREDRSSCPNPSN